MPSSNSPLGKNLKSVATYLTRWVRSKPKLEGKDPTSLSELRGARDREELEDKEDGEEIVKEEQLPAKRLVAPVSTRLTRKPAIKKVIIDNKPDLPAVAPRGANAGPKPKPKPDLRSPISDLLSSFPEHTNLVGQSLDIRIQGKTHNLIIRTDSLLLDAQKYVIGASGGALGADVELDILNCTRSGNTLSLKAGAFGKDATIIWTAAELEELFEQLLRGKTTKCKTDRGQTLEIKRSNY